MKQDSTYSSIEKQDCQKCNSTEIWTRILTDNDWETEFEWIRTNSWPWSYSSEAEIRWFVPKNQESGIYKILHFGAYRTLSGEIISYSGSTESFVLK